MLEPEEKSNLTPLNDPVAAVGAVPASSTLNVTRPELVNIVKEDTLESQYLPFPSGISQAVNTTITANQQRPIPSLTLPRPAASVPIPAGQVIKYCPKHPAISVTLDGKDLWDEFYRVGTEMIVNRAGRRMFPGFSVNISGLKPKSKYVMKLEILLADSHRFKFINSRWLPIGSAEPQPQYETYVHPDSPNTGTFWTRHGVSFKKLKITNNKDSPNSNAVLHSMHKYFLRLYIEEVKKVSPPGGTAIENGEREGGVNGEDKRHGASQQMVAKSIMSIEFPETTFVAVTAYQNEEVTQLKITNNPFAKAFRDNSLDLEWDSTQALYAGNNSSSYFSPATVTQPDNL
ncbi:PREDICTED: T-box transcription factor TBX5-A-like isoform X2 [Amphimedon queenslandica]|uniref:T-box domain-containing protein n=1 Tax=Amphimedon queenslandica TaxID=400682 RepID=A0AAN0K509_AMPQE|nr:PREDICTED: T-box transcription factor TBX5-A-like isoform X2 [Amphimedon queenslandica]|eukprot:XP_019864386.1 PREDICTED: T-box transcription factor TBX5-A-like isoform X2 [Amphimedon queenslandica]